MASFDVAFAQRTGDVVALQTFLTTDLQAGDTVTVANVGNGMDGTFTLISTAPYALVNVDEYGELIFDASIIRLNQIIYKDAGADVEWAAVSTGTVTYTQSVVWVQAGDVLTWLGLEPATQNDVEYLEMCTAAANAFCYRKRREAGYSDTMTTVPGPDVFQGTVLYAGMLYRERGAVDGFASFDSMGNPAPTMSIGRIMQLLGCGRPQVG